MDLRKTVRLAMLLSLSIVLNLIESTIPVAGMIMPGAKLGIANAVVIIVIYLYGFKEALFLSVTRVLLTGMIKTGLFNIIFFFSFSGALLSVLFMFLCKKFTGLSIVGISIVGAIAHSAGQILVAIIFLQTVNIIFYLPYLLVLSVPTGIVVGMTAKEVLKFHNQL
mgnify:CR=1 FL=1